MRRALAMVCLFVPVSAGASAPAASQRDHAAACSWDRPGHDPYQGDVPAAVDAYPDIPAAVRQRLRARMEERRYDDIAEIRRDSIAGRAHYAPDLAGMHFGARRLCAKVSRARWTDTMVERGLVYCDSGHCLIVPTVCRNVSRVRRLDEPPLVLAHAPTPTPTPPVAAIAAPHDDSELQFDPPSAGGPPPGPEVAPRPSALRPLVWPGAVAVTGWVLGPIDRPANPRGSDLATDLARIDAAIPGLPEPAAWLMWLGALAGVVVLRRRRPGA